MSDNLTALITRAQAQLLDDGTLFSTTAMTAAFRSALARFNETAPYFKTGVLAVVAGRNVYSLASLTGLLGFLDFVGVWDAKETPLACDFYREDGTFFFRLREALASGTLTVRYTIPHTVNGLAAASTSTLTADQDQVLIDGACAEALRARLLSRAEKVNPSDDTLESYTFAAAAFERAFGLGLARYARRVPGVGEPSTAHWADEWEGWQA